MIKNLLCAALVIVTALGCTDRSAEQTQDQQNSEEIKVRAVYLGPVFEGAGILVNHEAIPGIMPAMKMQLRLEEGINPPDIQTGKKVTLSLLDTEQGLRVTDFEILPDSTTLTLAE